MIFVFQASHSGYNSEEPASLTVTVGRLVVNVVPPVTVVPTVEVAVVHTEDAVEVEELEVIVVLDELTDDEVEVVGVVEDVDVVVVEVVFDALSATYAPTPAITTITRTITAIATVLIASFPPLFVRSCLFKMNTRNRNVSTSCIFFAN